MVPLIELWNFGGSLVLDIRERRLKSFNLIFKFKMFMRDLRIQAGNFTV